MKYQFPVIKHINDVLPVIKENNEFIVVDKGDYKVVNYVVATNDTFPQVTSNEGAIRRECRGLIFDKEGNILSRRLHKFFNLNEKPENHHTLVDLSAPHVILEKLDGSMITPIIIGDVVRWGTKMGITDTSMEAETFIASNPQREYVKLAKSFHLYGKTPIFEWCSRKNRIVIDYPEDKLVLIAIRDNITGHYEEYQFLQVVSNTYNVPVVKYYDSLLPNIEQIAKDISSKEGEEGIVIRFMDGHMIKVKSDWYVKIHRAKDILTREHDVVSLILENKLDDLKPLLLEEDLKKLNEFEIKFIAKVGELSLLLSKHHVEYKNYSRKDFALTVDLPKWEKSLLFRLWDGQHKPMEVLVEFLLKNSNKKSNYEELKKTLFEGINYV